MKNLTDKIAYYDFAARISLRSSIPVPYPYDILNIWNFLPRGIIPLIRSELYTIIDATER